MNRAAMTLIAIVCLSCAHAGAPPDADLVLPGTFSEQTTLSDLQARFGAANVTIADVPDSEGATSRVVLLFPDDPTLRATARFWDEDTLVHLSSVTVTDPESRWRGKLGVRIGTTFAELRRLNGAEFFYEGFYPDGSGRVRDGWNAGALDVAEERAPVLRRRARAARAAGHRPLEGGAERRDADLERRPSLPAARRARGGIGADGVVEPRRRVVAASRAGTVVNG